MTDAIWLSDDRWVVIAPEDQAVDLVDFGRRTVARFDKSAARAFAQRVEIEPRDVVRRASTAYRPPLDFEVDVALYVCMIGGKRRESLGEDLS